MTRDEMAKEVADAAAFFGGILGARLQQKAEEIQRAAEQERQQAD